MVHSNRIVAATWSHSVGWSGRQSWIPSKFQIWIKPDFHFFRIEHSTIKNPRLKHIFNSELEEMKTSFAELKKTVDDRAFKTEIM